jgi:hypothetical protein
VLCLGDQDRVRTIATRQISTMAKTRARDQLVEILSNSVWILVVLVAFFLSLPGDQDRVRTIATRQISTTYSIKVVSWMATEAFLDYGIDLVSELARNSNTQKRYVSDSLMLMATFW